MSVTLSIIIPVFNCEKTIKKCLDSIFNQKTELEYEVILVDDGSSDNTVKVVESTISGRKNSRLICQENAGAGAARNKALSYAKGEYLFFIDGDDYISGNCLNILNMEIQKKENLDILIFMYRYYDEESCTFKKMSQRDAAVYYDTAFQNRIFSFEEFPQLHECITYPWNKLFRRSFVDENKLKFSETVVHNDIFFNVASLARAKRIKIIHDILYVHLVNAKGGQLTQVVDARRLNAIRVLDQCDTFLQNEMLKEKCQLLPYIAFKANLLDWIIMKMEGELRERFITYLRDFLRTLDQDTIIRLMAHRISTISLKNFMWKMGLPKRGERFTNDGRLLLSIVIPIYNVEPWLPQCLQSVADQTLNPGNFEVIMVDDKSTDHSVDICRDFCTRYSNFRLIELPENTPGGAGIPSNIGIEEARGEYIGFVDSDDYIEPEMFEELLLKAMDTKADLTICDFTIYYQKEKRLAPSNDQKAWKELCKTDFQKTPFRIIQQKTLALSAVPWRKLYRRDFLNTFNIRYPEGDFFYEDNPLHWLAVVQSRRIAVLDMPLITHRIGRVGQTMDGKPERLAAFAVHAQTIKNFLESTDNCNEYKIEYLRWILSQSAWIVPKLGKYRGTYIRTLRNLCRSTTLEDLKAYRKMAPHKISTLYYNFMLINGHYYLGKFIRWTINRFGNIKKATFNKV